MQALVVRDEAPIHDRPRHQFQDPGQVGSMLDEIALLQDRITGLETGAGPAIVPSEASWGALDAAFIVLRTELNRIQNASPTAKIGVDALRQALQAALWSPDVLDAAFNTLRAEMTQMQHSSLPGRIGLNALREALRTSLSGPNPDAVAARDWNSGHWPGVPGEPVDPDKDGWHWVRAPGKPLVVLSWHAETRAWGHRVGISPQKAAADGLRYFGPCVPPAGAMAAG